MQLKNVWLPEGIIEIAAPYFNGKFAEHFNVRVSGGSEIFLGDPGDPQRKRITLTETEKEYATDGTSSEIPLDQRFIDPTMALLGAELFQDGVFLFRELRSGDEIREHFRIRYKSYIDMGHIPPIKDGIDIDTYDLFSRFFGVFYREDGTWEQVGGMRMVTRLPSPHRRVVESMVEQTRDPYFDVVKDTLNNGGKGPKDFPTLESFDLDQIVLESGEGLVEFSRNAVIPEYRGHRLSSVMLLFVYGAGLDSGFDTAIGSCKLGGEGFYIGKGYRVVEEAGIHKYMLNGIESVALEIKLKQLPPDIDYITMLIRNRLRENNQLNFLRMNYRARPSERRKL